jgi:aerobic carbon-monoxide dehydrogenase large subunit
MTHSAEPGGHAAGDEGSPVSRRRDGGQLRLEDHRLLTVGGTYTADVEDDRLSGACHVSFVRSPVAHARIVAVDVTAARSAPGVVAVFSGSDMVGDAGSGPLAAPAAAFADARMRRPVLAVDRVRFVGEPLAVVVAEDPYRGADAAALVRVALDPLPPVPGPDSAVGDEVLLFPEVGTNVAAVFGDVDPVPDLFDDCEVVVRATVMNQRVAPAPLEVRAAAASCGPDGRTVVWMPSQGAQRSRLALAAMLGVEPDRLVVITPDVGGAFGAKTDADPEHALVAWVAGRLQRPARWQETRSESLLGMRHGRGQRQSIAIGGNRDGTLRAYELEVLQDAGAYPDVGAGLPRHTILMAAGPYDFARVRAVARSVVTTTTPVGAYRGAGRPEATAALERVVDLFAAQIDMDAADVRRRNLLRRFDKPYRTLTGASYDNGDFPLALERALAAANYPALRAEQARRRAAGDPVMLGVGVACYVEITGMGGPGRKPRERASVEVFPDGSVQVLTGTSSHGQGHATAWANLVGERLGVAPARVNVQWGNTDLVPLGGGTTSSRSLQLGGAAVWMAAGELLRMARDRAAGLLGNPTRELTFDPARSGFAEPDGGHGVVSLAELAATGSLVAHAVFEAPDATATFGAHVAVAEVDVETGKVTLRRVVAVDDAGTVLNPALAQGQRHGAIVQGIGQALLEEVGFDRAGHPRATSLADYPLPSMTDVPELELVDMQTATEFNPLGVKGLGEAGTVGATPAVQNSVIDALAHLGVRHIDMPATPLNVWRALTAARATGTP